MEAIVLGKAEGEVHEAGGVRMRVLARAPDSPIAVTDSTLPPGAAHTFANRGAVPARVLKIFQPAGLEQYLVEAFRRMAEGRPWSPAEMAEIASLYDFEPVTAEA